MLSVEPSTSLRIDRSMEKIIWENCNYTSELSNYLKGYYISFKGNNSPEAHKVQLLDNSKATGCYSNAKSVVYFPKFYTFTSNHTQ